MVGFSSRRDGSWPYEEDNFLSPAGQLFSYTLANIVEGSNRKECRRTVKNIIFRKQANLWLTYR
jgi:hypothetical protein